MFAFFRRRAKSSSATSAIQLLLNGLATLTSTSASGPDISEDPIDFIWGRKSVGISMGASVFSSTAQNHNRSSVFKVPRQFSSSFFQPTHSTLYSIASPSNRTKTMTSRRPMTVSPLWLQGSILTFIVGFSFLSFSAIRIYQDHAPVPERIVDEAGNVLFTRQQILDGQEQFLTYGLMQFGTVYGHGAYLGPDFTADYLHRMALHMNKRYGDDEAAQGEPAASCKPIATIRRRERSSGPTGRSRPSRRSTHHFERAGVQPEGRAARGSSRA